MLGEHDYQDKRWMYDESMRMPLIISPEARDCDITTGEVTENAGRDITIH